MSFFKKLFGGKVQVGGEISDEQIRQLVLNAVKKIDPNIDMRPSPDDPSLILMNSGNEQEGYISIGNLSAHIRAYPDQDSSEEIEHFANAVIYSQQEPEDVDLNKVYPLLRPTEYVEQFSTAIENPDNEFLTTPLIGDLHVVFMEDSPEAMRGLTKGDLNDFEKLDLRKLSIENVKQWLPSLFCDDSLPGIFMYSIEDNGYLISGMMLLDEFWEILEEKHGPNFLFALPRKDQFFVFDPNQTNALDIGKRMVQVTWEDNFNLVSPLIFKRTNGSIEVVKAS